MSAFKSIKLRLQILEMISLKQWHSILCSKVILDQLDMLKDILDQRLLKEFSLILEDSMNLIMEECHLLELKWVLDSETRFIQDKVS